MMRRPLRPPRPHFEARAKGENPDTIERENLRARHEAERDRLRAQAEGRLLVLAVFFLCGFALVGSQNGATSRAQKPEEPRAATTTARSSAARADKSSTGRGGFSRRNFTTHSLYDPAAADDRQGEGPRGNWRGYSPISTPDELYADFTGARKFIWIKRRISPEQQQAVHDIGDPGLRFGAARDCGSIPTAGSPPTAPAREVRPRGCPLGESWDGPASEKAFERIARPGPRAPSHCGFSPRPHVQAAVERVWRGACG